MDRGDLVTYWARALRDFSYAPAEATSYALRVSSGTSGQGVMVALTRLTPEAIEDWFAGKGRSVLCFGTRAVRLYNVLGTLRAGLDALALDAVDLEPSRLELVAQFKPTRFHGFPSFILKVASQLPKEVRSDVVELRLVGELMTESMERAFEEYFPNAQARSIYAASEVGALTQPSCGHLPRNHFHLRPGVKLQVGEPDERGVGELVVGKMVGDYRVEGYRTGDLGRLYACKCPCGQRTALEVLGRAGFDYLKLAGGVLRVEEFDRVLLPHRSAVADYRVEATTLAQGGAVVGKVSVTLYCPSQPTEALKRELAESLAGAYATPTRTLGQLATQGLFAPLDVSFTEQPFVQGHKPVRLRYLA